MDNDFGRRIKTVCTCYDCDHQWHPKKIEYEIDK